MKSERNNRSGRRKVLTVLGMVTVAIGFVCARSTAQPDPAATLAYRFDNPPQSVRPQVRFWTPDAAISDSGLRRDIDTLAKSGFGGLEVVGFGAPGVGPEYAWGSEAWNRLMVTAASQAVKDGITVDFANGPRWPIAAPAIKSAEDPAALYELTFGSATLEPGKSYNGAVPKRRKTHGEGTTKLDAVLAYRMIGSKTLDAASVIDLTAKTKIDPADNANSTVEFTPPQGSDAWVLFTFWEQPAALHRKL